MTSYEIHRFEFLPDAVELLNDEGSKWRVRLPPNGSSLDAGLRPDHIAALGAFKERVVGRLVCRFKDGTPALAALYLDMEGHLHWGKPFPAPPETEDGM